MRISDWSSDVCSSDLISTGSVRPISSTSGEDPSGEADNWKRNCALGASGARQRKRYCRYRPARRSSRLVLMRLSLRSKAYVDGRPSSPFASIAVTRTNEVPFGNDAKLASGVRSEKRRGGKGGVSRG